MVPGVRVSIHILEYIMSSWSCVAAAKGRTAGVVCALVAVSAFVVACASDFFESRRNDERNIE